MGIAGTKNVNPSVPAVVLPHGAHAACSKQTDPPKYQNIVQLFKANQIFVRVERSIGRKSTVSVDRNTFCSARNRLLSENKSLSRYLAFGIDLRLKQAVVENLGTNPGDFEQLS